MRTERKWAIMALIGAAAYILLTDPDLIQEALQMVKIAHASNPKTDRPDPGAGTIS
jgi:hypothetical protein